MDYLDQVTIQRHDFVGEISSQWRREKGFRG